MKVELKTDKSTIKATDAIPGNIYSLDGHLYIRVSTTSSGFLPQFLSIPDCRILTSCHNTEVIDLGEAKIGLVS